MSETTDTANGASVATAKGEPKRHYLSQADIPEHKLEDALRVPRAIADNYGKAPTSPLDLAAALEIKPQGRRIRGLTGSAIAYGLTEGGAWAEEISLTDLGLRIVAPTVEGDDVRAMREALLRPRVIREFLEQYDGSKLPPDRIACNVLEQLGVPAAKTQAALDLIRDSIMLLGLYREIKGDLYVQLSSTRINPSIGESGSEGESEPEGAQPDPEPLETPTPLTVAEPAAIAAGAQSPDSQAAQLPVFITHGKHSGPIVKQLKEILGFGGFESIVAEERETTAKPVPLKVLGDMRACGAAIIHVSGERRVLDQDGEEHVMLNENVLIEIGAAMALYSDRFILLVEKGIVLPSNLQGLYVAYYEGRELDQQATMKLLRAFKDFRAPPQE